MSTAELVLEYIKALTWPCVAVGAIWTFRKPLATKIKGLKTLDAAGVKTTFETEAEALETQADQVATEVEAAAAEPEGGEVDARSLGDGETKRPGGSDADLSAAAKAVKVAQARQALATLEAARNFDVARRVAVADPNAAVMAAWRQVEQGLSAVPTLMGSAGDSRGFFDPAAVVAKLGLGPELRDAFRELRRLRNEVTHAVEDVTIAGALSYIAAAERLMTTVVLVVTSRLRHPSRYQETADMLGLDHDQADSE